MSHSLATELDKPEMFATARSRRRLLEWIHRVLYWSGASEIYRQCWRWQGASILLYHSVAQPHEAPWIDPSFNIEESLFRRQMEFLARHRRVVSLETLVDSLAANTPVRTGTVVLTFDDGYLNNLRVVAPILAEYGLPMTLFLTTGYVSREHGTSCDALYAMFRTRQRQQLSVGWLPKRYSNLTHDGQGADAYREVGDALVTASASERKDMLEDIERELRPASKPPRLLLEWEEVRELLESYPLTELGVHTVNHLDLTRCDAGLARREIEQSAADLEREVGIRPRHMSYPYGRCNAEIRDIAMEFGFRSAVATGPARLVKPGADQFAFPRWEVGRSMTLFRFCTGGAYPNLPHAITGRV